MATAQPVPAACCILLVYGVPGSGKTLLTDYLCSKSVECSWSVLPVHFDSCYPPDARATPMHEELGESGENAEPFAMKRERHQVAECIERFIQVSVLGDQCAGSAPQLWDRFTSNLQQHFFCHQDGSLHLPSPSVIALDDNLHLRSMRYQFYQMARKYCLGFAELCVCCDVTVAQARNSKRQTPIPDATIVSMEQRLELPEPAKHHWEKQSAAVHSNRPKEEFLSHAWVEASRLISQALTNPEQPLPQEDNSLIKEMCRAENLESYLHQADIILRKCVSASFSECRGSEKASLAKCANSVRKELLNEARTGELLVEHKLSVISPTSREFESTLQTLFREKLDSHFHT